MKVVINGCYGGYNLSALAISEWCKRKKKPCYFFTHSEKKGYMPVELADITSRSYSWFAFTVPNPDDFDDRDDSIHIDDYYTIERNDPDLINVVEQLGVVANDDCADLSIVDIPDGVDYIIEEYDGIEHIAEKHRTWH